MGDFYQNGLVTTLHNLNNSVNTTIEKKLVEFSKDRPVALILPTLFSELKEPALTNILKELIEIEYINEIIIGLDCANKDEFEYAKEYFSVLPQNHKILWNDGSKLKKLEQKLLEKGIAPISKGKGKNVWHCFGYFLASNNSDVVALLDCDIKTFNRSMLTRLIYPLVDPSFNYNFSKGYYFRSDGIALKGRVTRLLVTPLVRTLKKFFPSERVLEYIDSFRYPLAGEFAMRSDLVKTLRIPSDWGLEIGILFDIERNNALGRICQVEITDRYDHKHQELSMDEKESGLAKMSFDIAGTFFEKLASNGHILTKETFSSIYSTYYRIALDFVARYHSDAVLNGLTLDRHIEEKSVELFAGMIHKAGERFMGEPTRIDHIPSWRRVISAIPTFLPDFHSAVELDNENSTK